MHMHPSPFPSTSTRQPQRGMRLLQLYPPSPQPNPNDAIEYPHELLVALFFFAEGGFVGGREGVEAGGERRDGRGEFFELIIDAVG